MAFQPPLQQVVHQHISKPPGNGMAVASLVLGIIAFVIGVWSLIPFVGAFFAALAFVPALLAVIFGHVGIGSSRTTGVGLGQAVTGMTLGYLTLGTLLVVTIIWVVMISSGSAFSVLYNWL